jgi:hypothetical protein
VVTCAGSASDTGIDDGRHRDAQDISPDDIDKASSSNLVSSAAGLIVSVEADCAVVAFKCDEAAAAAACAVASDAAAAAAEASLWSVVVTKDGRSVYENRFRTICFVSFRFLLISYLQQISCNSRGDTCCHPSSPVLSTTQLFEVSSPFLRSRTSSPPQTSSNVLFSNGAMS